MHTATTKSLTVDEPHYIGKGLHLWESGDYHYARSLLFHPPLAYHLASLPLLALDLDGIERDAHVGRRLRAGPTPDPNLVRVLSRTSFIALACWGAILVFLWARELAGDGAAVLAAGLYTLSPTVLANAGLAHSDITVTVFFVQTLYAVWRWAQKPSPLRLVAAGLSLGLALASKLSALLLLPIIAVQLAGLAAFPATRSPSIPGRQGDRLLARLARALAALMAMVACATFVVWLSYGGSFASTKGIGGRFAEYTLPAYLHSLLFDVNANEQGRTLFLFGKHTKEGLWYFFPLTFLVKTPIATLILIVLAAVSRRPQMRRFTLFAGCAITVYLVVACFVLRVPLGFRYLLPVLPLIHLVSAVRIVPIEGGARRALVAGALVWLAATGLYYHPHYLAYFNAFVGGPANASRYLVESNLDWGQDLSTLARYLEERGNPPIHLAYFGPGDPAQYGIRATRLRRCEPTTGLVAISATILRRVYAPWNPFKPAPEGCFDWLLAHEPIAMPGYSIFVYEIAPDPVR